MSPLHIHISNIDIQIAQFARAIALPVRVFILRMIAENGNTLTKQAIYTTVFKASTINKHLLELRALGIVKVKTVKAQATYFIDQGVLDQMSANFGALFQVRPLQAPARLQTILQDADIAVSKPNHFGIYIKENRMDMNLSQAALAAKLSIDRALLSRIESGKKCFCENKLSLLALAIQVDVKEVELAFDNYKPVKDGSKQ